MQWTELVMNVYVSCESFYGFFKRNLEQEDNLSFSPRAQFWSLSVLMNYKWKFTYALMFTIVMSVAGVEKISSKAASYSKLDRVKIVPVRNGRIKYLSELNSYSRGEYKNK